MTCEFKVAENGDIFVLNTDVICTLCSLMVGRKCINLQFVIKCCEREGREADEEGGDVIKNGQDTEFSILVAFKLDHLQPFKLILLLT